MWVVTAGLGLVILTVWIIWRKRRFSVLKELGIPGPEPNILFGNLWELSAKGPLECHKTWIKKYGRVVGYYYGFQPIILVADTDLLKRIQISEFSKFVNRPELNHSPLQIGFPKSLISQRDKRWKEIRSLVAPSFTTSKMKLMVPMMTNAIDSLVEHIGKKAKTGETFDIYKMYQGLTMNVIGRTAFGIHTDVQNNPKDPFLRTSRILLRRSISSLMVLFTLSFPEFEGLWRLVNLFNMRLKNKGKHPRTELFSGVRDVIQMRRTDKSARRHDLLQLMVDAEISEVDLRNVKDADLVAGDDEAEEYSRKETAEAAMKQSTKLLRHVTDDEIIDNAALFFIAGYETTSSALGLITACLIKHSDVQEKIRVEVKDLIQKEGSLNYTSVQKLKYLDQVLCESLRMYPPVYLFVNREAAEDTQFGDMLIKKGSAVQVPVYFLHHDSDLWENPEIFNPDRFSEENKLTHHPMAWQAFGAGPRNCVGLRLAKMEIKFALAHILQKYTLVSTDESDKEPINFRVSLTLLNPEKGVYVKAVPC